MYLKFSGNNFLGALHLWSQTERGISDNLEMKWGPDISDPQLLRNTTKNVRYLFPHYFCDYN